MSLYDAEDFHYKNKVFILTEKKSNYNTVDY